MVKNNKQWPRVDSMQADILYNRILTEGNIGRKIVDREGRAWVMIALTEEEIDQVASLAYDRAEDDGDADDN